MKLLENDENLWLLYEKFEDLKYLVQPSEKWLIQGDRQSNK